MKKMIIILISSGLIGPIVLFSVFIGFSNILALILYPLSFVLGSVGMALLRKELKEIGISSAKSENKELPVQTALTQPVKQEQLSKNDQENDFSPAITISTGEIDVYGKTLPALFQSIVDYLNKTTEPISESLLIIKTGMKDFISQINEHDQEIISSATLNKITGSVENLHENMNQVSRKSIDAFLVFKGNFQNLQDVMNSIFSLTGDISEIAERVHVLSINASIESARAGIHGSGFKVIANEIQKLAQETQNFLKDINLTAGTSREIFRTVDRELEEKRSSLEFMVHKEKETFNYLNESITHHYVQFKDLYSSIQKFVKDLEGNMNGLFPLSMLHAIIIQEVENLDLVTGDFLKALNQIFLNPQESDRDFDPLTSIERQRRRLTTSREMDALEKAISYLDLRKKIDLKRSDNDFELF